MKKWLPVFIAFVLFVSIFSPVTAFEAEPQSSMKIKDAQTRIGITSTNRVWLAGWTETFFNEQKVSVTVYLQYWNGSKWVDYTSWSASNNNSDFVSLYREVTPPSGYYYRVRGVHTAESGGIKEVLYSVTDYIYY